MKSLKKIQLLLFGLFTNFPGNPGLAAPPLTFNDQMIQIRGALQNSPSIGGG
jgi:hypothetical protein